MSGLPQKSQRNVNTSNQFSVLCIVFQREIECSVNYCCYKPINLSATWDQNTSLTVCYLIPLLTRSPGNQLLNAPQTMYRQNSATLHHSAKNFKNIYKTWPKSKSGLELVRIYILHCLLLNNKHSSVSIIFMTALLCL